MTTKVAQVFVMEEMPDYARMFREAQADLVLTRKMCNSQDEIIAAAVNADAIIVAGPYQPITRKVMEALDRCRFIQSLGMGFERIDVAAATELGIMVANVPDYGLEEVSDHTMALILACTRKIIILNNATRSGKWTATVAPYIRQNIWPGLSRLQGQTLGMVGFGRTAQALVPKAKGFGLRLVAHARYVPQSVYDSFGVERMGFDELLDVSDIVSIHVPLTKETEGLMGMEQFKKMKRTAYLINISRGAVVKTGELYEALTQNLLAGAGLDVIDPEPINMDNPILGLDNVIVTAHTAGVSPIAIAELAKRPGEEMINVLVKGEWPRGLVNPQVKEKYQQRWGIRSSRQN